MSFVCRDSESRLEIETILQNFSRLTSLTLRRSGVGSGTPSRHLGILPDLEELTICACNGVTHETLYHLGGLTNLKKSDISCNEASLLTISGKNCSCYH